MNFGTDRVLGPIQRLVATAQNGLEVLRVGGLESQRASSPFEVVEETKMYRLRRYFAADVDADRPVIVLVPPMMLDADVWDVSPDKGAAGVLHELGIDVWVIDFGSPATREGGWERSMADHVVAVSEAIDFVVGHTGRSVHLGGYSQGGMFCYQAAAYRQSKDLLSVVTFGSPVNLIAALPLGIPAGIAIKGAGFLADHVFTRLPITDTMARTGFQLLDPVKTVRSRIDFVRQLHDRDALLPREAQRRFIEQEGWVPWSGPAVAELLKQLVVHNRMMSGGIVINDRLITLADITCPILAFIGEVDDIGQPVAVRGIRNAAPRAEVYEIDVRAGHFGLVVGSTAATQTWPAVADWMRWREGAGDKPEILLDMSFDAADESPLTPLTRLLQTAGSVAEVGVGVGRTVVEAAANTLRGSAELSGEAARTLPRLVRLGSIQPHTRISLGSLLAEQGKRAPIGECFLFEDRVHTNAAVNTRIDNVVRGLIEVGVRPAHRIGVVMETRPSALVTVAALSRLGAVAVLLAPGSDLAQAIDLTEIDTIVTDPDNLEGVAETGHKVLVLGGGDARGLAVPTDARIIDLEQIDPAAVTVPDWYRPNPGRARDLAFVLVSGTGAAMEAKLITNYRWALSAFGTASAADLGRSDTVYCLAPLHHSSGLLVSVGGAVAGGSRIALARNLDPAKFPEEVRRYGVTVVTYTWTMMREILDSEQSSLERSHPVRLFIGSGMPVGLWRRTLERYAPARVVEFYASTEGDVVLANVSGVKVGCKGRPVPGTARVALAAYDPVAEKFFEDERGFIRLAEPNEVGLLLGRVSADAPLPQGGMRSVFEPGDAWVPTENLFRQDADGDYWLLDHKRLLVKARRGAVFTQPIIDILGEIRDVDLVVAYGVPYRGKDIAIAAVTLHDGGELTAAKVTATLSGLQPSERPEVVHVVDSIPVGSSYRPKPGPLREAGLPMPGERTFFYDDAAGEYAVLTDEVAAELRRRAHEEDQ